jgi:hypothetical protein
MNRALVRAEVHISRHSDVRFVLGSCDIELGVSVTCISIHLVNRNTTALVALAAGLACIAHHQNEVNQLSPALRTTLLCNKAPSQTRLSSADYRMRYPLCGNEFLRFSYMHAL